MKRETTTPAFEYFKIGASMIIGAAVLLLAEINFLISRGCFVTHEQAQIKRESEIQITRQMVSPIDEYEYQWDQVYK